MSSSLRQWVGLATRFLLGVLLSTAHGMIHHVRARAAVWFYHLLVLMRGLRVMLMDNQVGSY